MDKAKFNWLRAIRTPKIGPIRFWEMLDKNPNFIEYLENYPLIKNLCSSDTIEKEIKEHQSNGYSLIAAYEKDFPAQLKFLPDCPPVLSYKGDLSLAQRPCIAIVGGRNASYHGKKYAENMAFELAERGFTIVSGLARGIDGAAHKGALNSSQGYTIAVMAGGVNHIYPPEHKDIYHQIAERGLVLSECPFNVTPDARHFPRRNRLISGLSVGVLVIEASLKSGSLITVNFALEQGKTIFSVPGFPYDPRSHGCNSLIKNGAVLIESINDIIENLDDQTLSLLKPQLKEETLDLNTLGVSTDLEESIDQKILNQLSANPIDMDDIIRMFDNQSLVLATISKLELDGKLIRLGNSIILNTQS